MYTHNVSPKNSPNREVCEYLFVHSKTRRVIIYALNDHIKYMKENRFFFYRNFFFNKSPKQARRKGGLDTLCELQGTN